MKKIFIALFVACSLCACGGNTNEKVTAASETKPAEIDLSKNPDYTTGLELMGKADCQTCHKVNEAAIGPSFSSIAAKYPNTPETLDTLAHKIIKGGSGNWGNVPMAAHSTISVADATAMVKYILLLKNP